MKGFGKTRLLTIGIAAVVGAAVVAKLIKAAREGKTDTFAYKAADTLGFV